MRFSRPTLALALCLALAGCLEWTVARGPVAQATESAMGHGSRGNVRVELNSGGVVAISDATVRNDSLIGIVPPAGRDQATLPVGYPLSEIRRVEYQRVNVASPLGFGVRMALLGLMAFAGIIIVGLSQLGD